MCLRAALGYDVRPLIIVAVGGTSTGHDLLERCAAAYPHLRARVDNVRMVVVCGPRIDPASVHVPVDVEGRGYVPRLFEHLGACDLAIIQGGGTTTLELTALRRPFIYFPVEGHFEQQYVAERAGRHGAGQPLAHSRTTPETLANTAIRPPGSEVTWPPIATDGAQRAAELVIDLLPRRLPQTSSAS